MAKLFETGDVVSFSLVVEGSTVAEREATGNGQVGGRAIGGLRIVNQRAILFSGFASGLGYCAQIGFRRHEVPCVGRRVRDEGSIRQDDRIPDGLFHGRLKFRAVRRRLDRRRFAATWRWANLAQSIRGSFGELGAITQRRS